MAANRFRSPKHPKQSTVARGGMTDDKTVKWLAARTAELTGRAEPSMPFGFNAWHPPLYTPPARRSLCGLRNLPRRKREAIRRDLRKKVAYQSEG